VIIIITIKRPIVFNVVFFCIYIAKVISFRIKSCSDISYSAADIAEFSKVGLEVGHIPADE
jgi:hypothetical protein